MSAPDRSSEVAAIVAQHMQLFTGDDGRRELVKILCRELNRQDGGNWGQLVKHDQGDKITADILVWKPTREHFDVLTDTGPFWGANGVLSNPAWEWLAVDDVPNPGPIVPTPGTPDESDPPPFLEDLTKAVTELAAEVASLRQAVQRPIVFPEYTNRFIGSITKK
jgi:hypothetical protein